jgi:hypothetical protein
VWLATALAVVVPFTGQGEARISETQSFLDFESPKVDRWRYRNELKAAHPLPFWMVGAYISEEPQYDFEVNRWSKHRATVGLTRKINAWLSADLYYRWDIIEQSKHEDE